ncbi:MAG: acyltransferase family protein [Hyphomonadaceae bacterium]
MIGGPDSGKERFVVLDGMRGVAALAVITDHVASPLMQAAVPGRYLAVDFFFVLSGFVLAHVYLARLASGAMSAGAFMRVRIARFAPLYLAALLLGAALAVLYAMRGWQDHTLPHVVASAAFGLFMAPTPPALSIWPDAPFPLNGPTWSLFFELLINAVFAVAALRWLKPAVVGLIAVIAGLIYIPVVFHYGQSDPGFAWSNFLGGFPRVTFMFFAGVWLYQMRDRWKLPVLPAWAAYALLAAVLMTPAQGVWRPVFDLVAAWVIFPALVLLAAETPVRGGVRRISAFMGLVSYGVYVLHVPLWGWLRLVLERLAGGPDPLPGVVNVALVAVIAVAAAAVLNAVYDVPLRRWLSGRRRRAP